MFLNNDITVHIKFEHVIDYSAKIFVTVHQFNWLVMNDTTMRKKGRTSEINTDLICFRDIDLKEEFITPGYKIINHRFHLLSLITGTNSLFHGILIF